ncbi:class I SAM-dependent methyltransferase [Bifidobacterium vespertilionis]|uniref:class I SAM-dependent methyltransferase n=1 Tax=Bifidobacterium vespertilionis TaxID=2562524 RepID=UPI001BDD0DB4|nr:SAM-dependent methyltransferase [Bifidobacterium vespertilionis]MBT1178736.1 SAM-dependent methyltransferase [Bifidobacterium vespertilionis]
MPNLPNIDEPTRAFIAAHRDEDVRELALHPGHAEGVDLPFALDQIAGRRKALSKLPEWAACEDVVYPPHLAMEQCSSQFTARYKADLARRLMAARTGGAPTNDKPAASDCADGAAPGRELIDLTGGFGVDFSYMARAFEHATYVERQTQLCDLAGHNMAALGLEGRTRIINGDSVAYLNGLPADSASMVFADPARRDEHGARTYAIADCTPDVLALKDRLLEVAPIVMIKLSPMLDWRKTVADFGRAVAEVHIVSTGNECKELLVVLRRRPTAADDVWIACVNDGQWLEYALGEETEAAAAATMETESARPVPIGEATTLYEPNASLMKAGCFALLSRRFHVRQIAPNSHLYVGSGTADPTFPGRAFAVQATSTMNKRELKAALAGIDQANVAVRNFPLTVAQLRRKLKLRDGGDVYLFATTTADGTHTLFVTRKA